MNITSSINISEKSKWYFSGLFFAALFLKPVYLRLFYNFSLMFGFNTSITTYIYYGAMWLFLILSFFQTDWNKTERYILFIIAFIFIFTIDYAFRPNSALYTTAGLVQNFLIFSSNSLVGSFLFFFIGGIIKDYAKTRRYFHIASRIGLAAVLIADYVSLFVIREKHYDDMAYAYGVCILVCDILFELLDKRQKIDIIFFAIGLLSLLISGTRGPLMCVAAVFVLWTFLYQKKLSVKIAAIFSAVTAIVFVFTNAFTQLLTVVDKAFKSVGIENLRILDYIYANSLTDTSGREEIYEVVWQKIFERPIIGYGIGGDRNFINDFYAHNIIFEVLCHFGLILGIIILAALIYWFIGGILCKNRDLAAISVVMVSAIVVKLLFSSSYIYSTELFLFLGLYLNYSGFTDRQPDMKVKIEDGVYNEKLSETENY